MTKFREHMGREDNLDEGSKSLNKAAYEKISDKMHKFINNEIKHIKDRNQIMKKLDATYQKLTGKSFFHGKIYNNDPILKKIKIY